MSKWIQNPDEHLREQAKQIDPLKINQGTVLSDSRQEIISTPPLNDIIDPSKLFPTWTYQNDEYYYQLINESWWLPDELWSQIISQVSARDWLACRVSHRFFKELFSDSETVTLMAAVVREKIQLLQQEYLQKTAECHFFKSIKGFMSQCQLCPIQVKKINRRKHLRKSHHKEIYNYETIRSGQKNDTTCLQCNGLLENHPTGSDFFGNKQRQCQLDVISCQYGPEFWFHPYDLTNKEKNKLADKKETPDCLLVSYRFLIERHQPACGISCQRECHLCGKYFVKKDWVDHVLNKCPERLDSCRYLGCRVKGKHLINHEKECGEFHLDRCWTCGKSFKLSEIIGHRSKCERNQGQLIWDAQGNYRRYK